MLRIIKNLFLISALVVVTRSGQLLAQSGDAGSAHSGHNMSQGPSPADAAAKFNAENVHYKSIATKRVIKPKTEADVEKSRIATMNFRLESATNGLPSSQYTVGMSYLNGTDGFQTNHALAGYWLQAAAAQGNSDAKAVLQKNPMLEAERAAHEKGNLEKPISTNGAGDRAIP
jgi:TPR repeat protein